MSRSELIWMASTVIGFCGLCTAIISNIFQMRQFNRQLKLNFFSEYTRRFQDTILNLPEQIYDPNFTLSQLAGEKREITLKYLRVYFNLCAEEYYLFKEGKVDKYIWQTWSRGFESFLQKRAFRDAWHIIESETLFYADFKEWVNGRIGSDAGRG
jgi:hypothetical protein